jgi:D-alanyl-lipoteichoic acid acyltransferase DltB (MBOAT superfamily)
MLGYFKYFNFFISNINAVTEASLPLHTIILPIGISFFVFQKIAFLVDAYRGQVKDFSLFRFTLFVFFFPQLIAGPIVHHSEMMPQFRRDLARRSGLPALALGLSILVIGLGKKVLIADGIADFATIVFDAAAAGVPITFIDAWCGTVAYTLQLYFDFSGYSDMAIGLAMLFGIRLPLNFNSPYKAASLIDFWRRWHMTLSRFLRDYIYIPLGGSRRTVTRRLINVFVVMLLGGIWHGAGWTFVLWGALHGAGLIVNLIYRLIKDDQTGTHGKPPLFSISHAATFLFVALTWVPFRAADLNATLSMFRGLCGLNGVVLPATYATHLAAFSSWLVTLGVRFEPVYLFSGITELGVLAALTLAVLLLPNTQEWFRYTGPDQNRHPHLPLARSFIHPWRPSPAWAIALSGYAIACLLYTARGGEFLYFQF